MILRAAVAIMAEKEGWPMDKITVACVNVARVDDAAYARLYAAASADRRAKADRYRLRADRVRCVAAEALLRRALGRSDFTVEQAPGGKPRIRDAAGFFYNLSHAGDWVVIAWGGSEVGVDVERVCMDEAKAGIARRHFTPDEREYVFSEPEGTGERFFRIWTGKESYLKYLGTGLTKRLDSFSVLDLPDVRFHHTPLPGGYCLTLCTQAEGYRVEWVEAGELA